MLQDNECIYYNMIINNKNRKNALVTGPIHFQSSFPGIEGNDLHNENNI